MWRNGIDYSNREKGNNQEAQNRTLIVQQFYYEWLLMFSHSVAYLCIHDQVESPFTKIAFLSSSKFMIVILICYPTIIFWSLFPLLLSFLRLAADNMRSSWQKKNPSSATYLYESSIKSNYAYLILLCTCLLHSTVLTSIFLKKYWL